MLDVNIERGRNLFNFIIEKEINKATSSSDKELLKYAQEYFADKVGVNGRPMGIFAAKKLADACIHSVTHSPSSKEKYLELVEHHYQILNATVARMSNKDDIKSRGESFVCEDKDDEISKHFKEINNPKEFFISAIEDEDGFVTELKAEVVDLIDDAAYFGELSIEGVRAIGALDISFDTTKNNLSEDEIRNLYQPGVRQKPENIRLDEQGRTVILCPSCNEDKIYPIGDGMFSCFECDTEFRFDCSSEDYLF